MQRPPFWHRKETSVPGERDKQGPGKLSGVEGAQAQTLSREACGDH